jgi:superoxide reductase
MKFYICRHCGNLIAMVHDSGVPVVCCGEKMEALEPNTVEASGEKHLPSVAVEDGVLRVNVGSVDHPMIPEHLIQWICLQTEKGVQGRALKPGDAPAAAFPLGEDKAVAVYAYCNLHGLWMTKV